MVTLMGEMSSTLIPLPSSSVPSTPTSTISSSIPSPTSILDGPNVDDNNCVLLGPFALFVQALMGILVVLTLVYKRHREVPKRPWKIWSLDISKQMLGQAFVHILNVLVSDSIAKNDKGNPCALYFLNIGVDTTVEGLALLNHAAVRLNACVQAIPWSSNVALGGVLIIYLTLRVLTHILTDVYHLSGFVSGEYFDPAPPVEIRRRRENERRRIKKKSKRKGIGRREGSLMSINSVGSSQSQPLPSNHQAETSQAEASTSTSTQEEATKLNRNGRPTFKTSFSHPRATSDSFYGPLSPTSVETENLSFGLPVPNSSIPNNSASSNKPVSQRPRLTYWSRQLLVYLLALLIMKLFVLLIFYIFPFLFTIGKWLLGLFGKHKRAQVVFAMAIFPLVMNVVQFWLIDSLLRHNPNTSSYSKLINEDEGERDGLMEGNGDGEADRSRDTGRGSGEDEVEDEDGNFKSNRNSNGGESEEEDDGWGWTDPRRSLEGFKNQTKKKLGRGFEVLKERFGTTNPNPDSNLTTIGSSSSKRSNRKGVPQSLRFSNTPSFNESQTHLVGEASDEEDEEDGDETSQAQITSPHRYPPSLEVSPVSSPRFKSAPKLSEAGAKKLVDTQEVDHDEDETQRKDWNRVISEDKAQKAD